jgi:hypothetical protein
MGNPIAEPLQLLQVWYSSHCDGDWEHQYGISIETLDNPGWLFKVDLTRTELCDQPFDQIHVEGDNKNDWYICSVKDHTFEGACGPNRLNKVIAVFLSWANREATDVR